MADGEGITTGMYLIISLHASNNVTTGNGFCLSRAGGDNSDANSMVIYKEGYRGTPNVATIYIDSDSGEATIVAPMLANKVACVRQSDMYQPTNSDGDPDGDPYPRPGANVWSEGNWGGRRGRWKIEAVPNVFGTYGGNTYQAYRFISSMSPDDHKMEMAVTGNANRTYVKFEAYADATGNLRHYWMLIPQPLVPDGFYNIRIAKSVHRLIVGNSNGSVTSVADSERNDNRDIWYIAKSEVDPTLVHIRNLGAMLAETDANGSTIASATGGYLIVNSDEVIKAKAGKTSRPVVGRLGNGGANQRWAILPKDESDTYNDNRYQAYDLLSNAFYTEYDYWAVSRYMLCPFKPASYNALTYPEFRLANFNTVSDPIMFQYFLTWAHAYNKNLTVPSKLALNYMGIPYFATFGISGSGKYVYPSWVGGDNDNWQLRYRITAYRRADDKIATSRAYADRSWKSILDDDSANNGWGDNETPNCGADLSYNESNSSGNGASGRYVAQLGIPITLGNAGAQMDKINIEFQVRAWDSSFDKISDSVSCHGGSASKLFTIAYLPELTLSQLKVDAYGMYLTYSSDFHRNGNKIVIESAGYAAQLPWKNKLTSYKAGTPMRARMENQKLCANGLANYTGKYYLDFGGAGVPDIGDEFPFTWSITSPDGVTNSGAMVLPVSSTDFSNAIVVNCPTSYTSNGTKILKIDVATSASQYFLRGSSRCTLVVNHRPKGTSAAGQFMRNASNLPYLEIVDIPRTTVGNAEYFAVPYPFGKPFMVEIIGDTTDSQGRIGRFAYYHSAFNQFRDKTRMWNFGNSIGDDCWYEIFVNEGENPSESVSTQFTSNAVKTTQRDWELVQFGNTPEQTRSVTGVVYDGLMNNYILRTKDFSKCKYAWYRSFDGEVLRVAITSVKETRKNWGMSVSVEMRRSDV